jgi:hypothetical protein
MPLALPPFELRLRDIGVGDDSALALLIRALKFRVVIHSVRTCVFQVEGESIDRSGCEKAQIVREAQRRGAILQEVAQRRGLHPSLLVHIQGMVDAQTFAHTAAGVVTIMMTLPTGVRIRLAAGFTDLRGGFDGLSALVQTALNENPYSGQTTCSNGLPTIQSTVSMSSCLGMSPTNLISLSRSRRRGRFYAT